MTDKDMLAVIWGETRGLTPRDGTSKSSTRLYAVVTHLADAARTRGTLPQFSAMEPPRLGSPDADDYVAMEKTARDVLGGTYGGEPLPARAALVEITETGARKADGPLPVPLAWIDNDAPVSADFVANGNTDKRIFRLYESPNAGRGNDLPFVSEYTGTGMPPPASQTNMRMLAWVIGALGTIAFLLGLVMSAWSGQQVGQARGVLSDTTPAVQNAFLESIHKTCLVDMKANPAMEQPAVCNRLLKVTVTTKEGKIVETAAWQNPTPVRSVLADAKGCPANKENEGCGIIWRTAFQLADDAHLHGLIIRTLQKVPAFLTGIGSNTGKISIFVPYLMLVAGVAAVIIALGLRTKSRVAGVWIDTRNRVSLARMQVTLWTVVALTGFAALAFFNIGMIDLGKLATYEAFPGIPASVAAALGISIVSPMISTLILPTKDASGKPIDFDIKGSVADLNKRGVPFFGQQSDGLQSNTSSADASITDIFMGEENANANVVDVSRLQNVVITVILVVSYFWMLLEVTSNMEVLQLLSDGNAFFKSMPDLGASFSWLLLVSHSAYLVAKAHDSQDLGP